jgi:predicted dehydrogenase
MTKKLNWGILGAGDIAHMQTADLTENGHSVVAVGSRDQTRGNEFAAKYGIPAVYTDYNALVNDPTVDIIYVATPHVFHLEHASLALNAGKHVLCEKPFTINAGESAQLLELADSKNLVILEAMWTRFLPHMVQLRQDLAAGLIGEVRGVHADFSVNFPVNEEHRLYNRSLGGGALLDLGIYPISFAIDVLGFPDKVTARGSLTHTMVDANDTVIFEYTDGRQATLTTALNASGPVTAVVLGTEGSIRIDSPFFTQVGYKRYSSFGALEAEFEVTPVSRGMQFQAVEIERLINAGERQSSIISNQDSHAIMQLMDGIRNQLGVTYLSESN